jgi:hypothetical protein
MGRSERTRLTHVRDMGGETWVALARRILEDDKSKGGQGWTPLAVSRDTSAGWPAISPRKAGVVVGTFSVQDLTQPRPRERGRGWSVAARQRDC